MDSVVHFEIPFSDGERAQKFYSDVFGWKISEVPGMPYWMVLTTESDDKGAPKNPGAINGGMYKRGEKGAKSPVVVMKVSSIDDHIRKIHDAGGKTVMEKTAVGEMGHYAQVSDTEDNIIALWENIKK